PGRNDREHVAAAPDAGRQHVFWSLNQPGDSSISPSRHRGAECRPGPAFREPMTPVITGPRPPDLRSIHEEDTTMRRPLTWLAPIVVALTIGVPGVALAGPHGMHAQARPGAAPAGGKQPAASSATAPKISRQSPAAEYTPTVRLALRTNGIAFVGAGG